MTLLLFHTFVHIGNGIGDSRHSTEHLSVESGDNQALARTARLLPPTYIGLCACFLWTNVWEILLINILNIDTHVLGIVTVVIVLDRTTTIELALIHRRRKLHNHTET